MLLFLVSEVVNDGDPDGSGAGYIGNSGAVDSDESGTFSNISI